MMSKLERHLGKYAIPHLINYLIGGYLIGYLLSFLNKLSGFAAIDLMTLEPALIFQKFQFWRVITWVLIPPPSGNIFFAAIMIYFYWQLGMALENVLGTFRFNVYIFGGILFTVIGAFILYGVYYFAGGVSVIGMGSYFSTYYINLGIFLAFAMCFPEEQILLYFIIPVKMKWMAILYVVLLLPNLVMGGWPTRVVIISSLFNFILFFISTKKHAGGWSRLSPGEAMRRRQFEREYRAGRARQGGGGGNPFGNPYGKQGASVDDGGRTIGIRRQGARHKCAICGRTEVSNPELEFRFCSKCNGNYEYCNDHLFSHAHVE